MNKTSQILKKHLKEKNISQSILAKILDVSPQYISNILNDIKSPSKKLLKKLVKILDISEEEYMLIEKFEIYKKTNKIYEETNKRANFYGIYTDKGFEINLSEKYIDTNIIDMENIKIIRFNEKFMLFKDINGEKLKDSSLYLVKINNKLDIIKLSILEDMFYFENLNNKKYVFSKKNRNIKFLSTKVGYLVLGGKNE